MAGHDRVGLSPSWTRPFLVFRYVNCTTCEDVIEPGDLAYLSERTGALCTYCAAAYEEWKAWSEAKD